jgi:SAM-dependent methyltransferase
VSSHGYDWTFVGESASAFNSVAEHYDDKFSHTALGRELRARVWQRLAARFPANSRILELNCGTGEDAGWLAKHGVAVVATDVSPAMLALAQHKTAGTPVKVMRLDLARPQADFVAGSFDGAFSNFGGLNCVADLRPLAQALARWLKPEAVLILVVMGPLCPWEILWYLLHLQLRTAFRRWARDGIAAHIGEQTIKVYYPWPGELRHIFAPEFRMVQMTGLGVLLPPSQLGHLVERWPGLFKRLARLEGRLAGRFPATLLNDHYLLELERITTDIPAATMEPKPWEPKPWEPKPWEPKP